VDGRRLLSGEELSQLRTAAEWGLLRSLSGHTVCLTGRMSMERAQVATLIQAAGGAWAATMSAAVTMLVVADDGTWTNKMRDAESRGVRVVRESDFAAGLLPTPAELLSGERAGWAPAR